MRQVLQKQKKQGRKRLDYDQRNGNESNQILLDTLTFADEE